jgi:hypothetical protein
MRFNIIHVEYLSYPLVNGQVDVFSYLSQQNGRNISVCMVGQCCETPIRVLKLFV